MKKTTLLCVGICAVLAFTSCKSSESAYKKAYEKAKQSEPVAPAQPQQAQETAPVVVPVQARPANDARVYDNLDNVSVRQESVTLISGTGLRAYSVVVGSFGVRANAEGLQQRLRDAGYNAQIVRNDDKNMFRVVASTYNDKASAVASRDQLRATYPDAWLLFFGQ